MDETDRKFSRPEAAAATAVLDAERSVPSSDQEPVSDQMGNNQELQEFLLNKCRNRWLSFS